ncbi:hypothetical protein [Pararobbsia silviterrae]|nr:hypothetical protein [Pararobbsia silviterrae]
MSDGTSEASVLSADENVVGFARFTAQLLASGGRGASREGLIKLYRTRIRELGLSRGGTVDRKELIRQLVAEFGEELVSHVDPAYRTARLSGWFHILIASTTWEVHVGRHLLLSYFLYEDADSFLKHYRQIALDSTVPIGLRSIRPVIPEAKPKQSDLMLQVIDASNGIANCDLDALWREHYGLLKRLIRQDPDALTKLESALDRNRGRKTNAAEIATVDAHPDDASWAERLRQSVPGFYDSAECPQNGTRNRLLRRIGWTRSSTIDLPRFPQLKRVLDAACESPWHFYIRRILWALAQPSAHTWSRGQIRDSSGVEWHKAIVLVDYCAQRGLPKTANSTSVMAILQDWQIDLNWEGPCPERVFASAGRNYRPRKHDGE